MDYKAKFLKIYANLPLSARNEIVVVIDNEPLTWNAARIEIDNDTEKGKRILAELQILGIL
jgi:hypothetical protein